MSAIHATAVPEKLTWTGGSEPLKASYGKLMMWFFLLSDTFTFSALLVTYRYIPRNVVRQNQNFVAIREVGGPSMTNDVYAREPNSSVFWFCGKVARVSGTSQECRIVG